MSSHQNFVDFIVDQMADAGLITAKKMFGEYGIYCDGKIVALVCDDQLFVKPTEAAKTFIGKITEAPPYPGAKMYLLISDEQLEEREWLTELIQITATALSIPTKKRL